MRNILTGQVAGYTERNKTKIKSKCEKLLDNMQHFGVSTIALGNAMGDEKLTVTAGTEVDRLWLLSSYFATGLVMMILTSVYYVHIFLE